MRRKYDLEALARQHGFSAKEMEKVCRISDLLEDVSAVKFLANRLSLYGGTALTFVYLPEISRLSIDLDFNYRHVDEADWGETRREIDKKLKEIIYRQEYQTADVAINASYPLTRFTVKYLNSLGSEDNFKIEIGYLRRTPILKSDVLGDFRHIGTRETFKVKTPAKEELFANNWCTLLYRKTLRDLFDTYQVAKININLETFRKCAIIDSLTHKKPRIHEINPYSLEQIPIDTGLRNLLQTEQMTKYDFPKMKRGAIEFTATRIAEITDGEKDAIDQFYDQKSFKPNLIDNTGLLHERIAEYPAVLRTLQQL